MLLSDLIDALEALLEQGGDMVVELDYGAPVTEVDHIYLEDRPSAQPVSVVIK